jgi:phosphatidylserine synthase
VFDPVLRRLKDRILNPVALALPGVSPGALTALGLVVGLGSAYGAWHGRFGLALALWLANRILDGLDGAVARVHGKATDFGGYIDLVADFVVYGAVPAAIALRPGADPALAAAAVVLLATFYVNTVSWTVASALLEKRAQGAA